MEMIGKARSIFLICLATSQPFILPFKPTSVTSALYFLVPPLNKVSASSPEDRMWLTKPPSANASSTTPCSGYSSSTIRIRGASGTLSPRHKMEGGRQRAVDPRLPLPKYINRDSVPGEIFKNVLKDGSTPQSTTPPSGNNRSAASAHVAGSLNAGQLYVSTKQAKVQWQRPHIRSHTGHSYSRYHALFWRCGAVRSARLTLSRSLVTGRYVHLADVRFDAHYGLRPDRERCLK